MFGVGRRLAHLIGPPHSPSHASLVSSSPIRPIRNE